MKSRQIAQEGAAYRDNTGTRSGVMSQKNLWFEDGHALLAMATAGAVPAAAQPGDEEADATRMQQA